MKFLKLHLTAFLGALLLFTISVYLVTFIPRESREMESQLVSGTPKRYSGKYANADKGDFVEVDLLGSIKSPDQLTLLGSSEFNLTNYATYNFFPDSLGIPVLGYGHAYHQNLSILIELLAANEFLEGSNICIFLSPHWFEINGTNIEAFIEFARPHFLNKILHDTAISLEYKIHIGKYIDAHYYDIDGVSATMDGFRDLYIAHKTLGIDKYILWAKQSLIPNRKHTNTRYQIDAMAPIQLDSQQVDFKKLQRELQSEFVKQVTTNDIYVQDDYFTTYIQTNGREYRKGLLHELDRSNQEYHDFTLLLKLLKERKVNASFIMQGVNPYFYDDMGKNDEFYHDMVQLIEDNNMPCLNLYVSDTGKYDPAILKDVMHLGDYGWMKANEFIYQTYYE